MNRLLSGMIAVAAVALAFPILADLGAPPAIEITPGVEPEASGKMKGSMIPTASSNSPCDVDIEASRTSKGGKIMLPKPSHKGKVSVEEAIGKRRTVRSFKSAPLTLPQLSQLLWAAQGITDERSGFRSAPSGGALYPLDVYAVVGESGVEGLAGGVYRYAPHGHALQKSAEGDRRSEVARAALEQGWIARAPVILVITAEYQRITGKYGERGKRYAKIEAGHVGQNIFLQAGALGLGAGIAGAYHDREIARAIGALAGHEPLSVMPVGYEE